MLFVMMLTNTEKNSAVSDEGHVMTTYGFFLVVRLASMQIKSGLLKSLSRKTLDSPLKYILIQVHDQQGQQYGVKKKKPKGKIVLKRDPTEKKRHKETENSVAGSRTRFICRCKQLLDHCTTVTHMI